MNRARRQPTEVSRVETHVSILEHEMNRARRAMELELVFYKVVFQSSSTK